MKILQEYESWDLCHREQITGTWQYDDSDLEKLSLIMTLHNVGFSSDEVQTYMHLVLEGNNTGAERIRMLNKKRRSTLDEIHIKEKQISQLDYLRYEISGTPSGKKDR